jgi:hypothetical protein
VSTLQSAGFSAGASSIGRCYRTNCFTANYLQVCVLSSLLNPCGCCLQAYPLQVARMHGALSNALARTIHSRVVCRVVSCRSAFGTPLTKPWSGIGAHPKAVSFQWLGTLRCEQRRRACPLHVALQQLTRLLFCIGIRVVVVGDGVEFYAHADVIIVKLPVHGALVSLVWQVCGHSNVPRPVHLLQGRVRVGRAVPRGSRLAHVDLHGAHRSAASATAALVCDSRATQGCAGQARASCSACMHS